MSLVSSLLRRAAPRAAYSSAPSSLPSSVGAVRALASGRADALLVSVKGVDKPGITANMSQIFHEIGAEFIDVDQAVTHHQLNLNFLLGMPDSGGGDMIKDILFKTSGLGIDVSLDVVPAEELKSQTAKKTYTLTVLKKGLGFDVISTLAGAAADNGYNIRKIERLHKVEMADSDAEKTSAVDLTLTAKEGSTGIDSFRELLFELQTGLGCDLALQKAGLNRRSKRLVVMDMDSTLIQQEVIDEIARTNGVYDQVSEITERAMNGEFDFDSSLRERVKLLEGTPVEVLDDVYQHRISLTPGAQTFCRILQQVGFKTAVISGGFTAITDRVQDDLNLDYGFANTLEIKDGLLTGKVVGGIVNKERKRDLTQSIAQAEKITMDQVVAIGDGANDLDMLNCVGLGIAFNAKPKVQEMSQYTVNQQRLDTILYLLGIRPSDVDQAEIDMIKEQRLHLTSMDDAPSDFGI